MVHELILKSAQFKTDEDILNHLNPKEYCRRPDQKIEEMHPQYDDIRLKPEKLNYPDLLNYPDFYEQTNLQHLCERFKPNPVWHNNIFLG